MFYRSLFTNAFTACALFSGEIALADSFNISNDDSSAYSLINSLGEPLNAGNAILGTFSSGTWSYDVTTSRWNFQGNSYAQDQLKYSDLMSMQNNFTSALTNIPEEQNGGVADGRFNLSGDYSSSLTSPVYLMVTGQDGETVPKLSQQDMVEKNQKRFRTDNLDTAFYKQIFRYYIKTIHQRSNSPVTDAVKQTDYPKETFAFQYPSPFPVTFI